MASTTLPQARRSKLDAMKQDALVPKALNNGCGLLYHKAVNVMVFLTVLFFAPLSFTYFLDQPHTSNLSDKVLAALVTPEFAYGKGSGTLSDSNGGQIVVYLRNFNAMLPHTISGAIAIVLRLIQFNTNLQFRYPVIHRYLGRLYALLAIMISWTSRSFLADAMPTKEVFSGDTFAYVLSSLSIGVLETLAFAVYAIWNGDIGSYREFIVLNYAFILSAPVLRICWVVLGQIWGETKFVINLYSSIFSGPFLIVASIFYLRSRLLRMASSLCGLLGLLFQVTKGPNFNGGSHPKAFFLALGPQLVCYMVSFNVLARAAKHRGDMGSYTAWITYQNGLISAPMWNVLISYVARDAMGCSEESLGMIAVSGGIVQGLFNAFVIYMFATSKLAAQYRQTVKGE